jgi:hypothetical protein
VKRAWPSWRPGPALGRRPEPTSGKGGGVMRAQGYGGGAPRRHREGRRDKPEVAPRTAIRTSGRWPPATPHLGSQSPPGPDHRYVLRSTSWTRRRCGSGRCLGWSRSARSHCLWKRQSYSPSEPRSPKYQPGSAECQTNCPPRRRQLHKCCDWRSGRPRWSSCARSTRSRNCSAVRSSPSRPRPAGCRPLLLAYRGRVHQRRRCSGGQLQAVRWQPTQG